MPELNGWGPLLALWIGGGIHLMWIVWRDNQRTPREILAAQSRIGDRARRGSRGHASEGGRARAPNDPIYLVATLSSPSFAIMSSADVSGRTIFSIAAIRPFLSM